MLQGLRNLYSKFVIKLIAIVINYPQIPILLPTLILFLLSYNITYDLTIKQTNSYLAYYFGDLKTNDAIQKKAQLLHRISSVDFQDNVLSIVEFKDDFNVLSYDYLHEINKILVKLENYTQGVIISPVHIWPIDFDKDNITQIEKLRSISNVVEYLNLKETWRLNYVFVDDIIKINHLVKYAKKLKILVLHHLDVNFDEITKDAVSGSKIVTFHETHSFDSSKSIHSFVSYLDKIVAKKNSGYMNFFIQIHVFFLAIIFTIFMWITISNEGKIRSNIGLIIGWVVEVFLSSAFALSYLSYRYESKSWKLLFELQSFGYVIFSLLLLSSKHLLITIDELGNDEELKNTSVDLPKRLYKFYQGPFKLILLPRTSFDVLLKLFSISVLKTVNDLILNYDKSVYLIYFGNKLSLIFRALMVAILVDHILQLTYLVSIIVIDLKKVEFTDILDKPNSNIPFINTSNKEMKSSNALSHLLLGSQYREKKRSFKYKLGLFLLNLKYPFFCNNNCIMFLVIEMFIWISILVTDINFMPENDFLLHFFSYNVLKNSNDIFFYLELLCIIIFIEASSFLVLKASPQSNIVNNYNQITNMDMQDFEVNEIKSFNTIELSNSAHGHNLDVIKILTNLNTSFVVSIGLDHRILVWSPLNKKDTQEPIDISSSILSKDGKETGFWPINHINISNEGNYIIMINYKYKLIRCYERRKLNFIWDVQLPDFFIELIKNKKAKIIESFFRKRTVAGFLARKILQKKRDKNPIERRGSRSSLVSVTSSINGNFTPMAYTEQNPKDEHSSEFENARNDFILILETGELLTVSCVTGYVAYVNVLNDMYAGSELEGLYITTAHKLITPRNYDRIIFYVSNCDVIIATAVNNKWKFRRLDVIEGFYNKPHYLVTQMQSSSSFDADHDFLSLYMEDSQMSRFRPPDFSSRLKDKTIKHFNKPSIVTVDFVGMIVRVIDSCAELIDIQTGILLKKFHVGHFKPSSFRVSHSEPTHCKFCGCASIQSFSIIYEDYNDNTLKVHTYETDAQRSKNNICLRVERDPREIRCIGFNAVIEHRFSYPDIEAWELTQVNVIMGIKKRSSVSSDIIGNDSNSTGIFNSGFRANNHELTNLRSRKKIVVNPSNNRAIDNDWEGFIVAAIDGQLINYKIPNGTNLNDSLPINRIHTIERFGYKSIILSFGNIIKIFYLGSDKLIESDIYYSGSNMTMNSVFEDPKTTLKSPSIQPVNGELLFISKRREMMERSKNRRSIRPTNLSAI